MATKRTRVTRTARQLVTPDAVALFREALPLQEWANKCIDSDRVCTHGGCDRYRDLSIALGRELHLKPFEVSPLDVEPGDEPPRSDSSASSASWPRGMELRQELENAK